MASYSATISKHQTLTAATVDTVTLGAEYNAVEVVNWGTANQIYFTADGSTPTVAGDNTYPVAPNGGALMVDVSTSGSTVVKLICTTANAYSVIGS